MKYKYPAIISYSMEDKVYYVDFPDIPNCFTDGSNLREALNNAEDVLNLMLLNSELEGLDIPEPSNISMRHLNAGEIISIIKADTEMYSKISA